MARWRSVALGLALACRALEALGAFAPNDPYFFSDTPAGFPGQWHLDRQSSSATIDANVRGAWDRGLTGAGVVIAVVEDGFELTHPDLAPNARPDLSWDYYSNSSTIAPDEHGTSVAGVAAARGGNGIGTTGAAPHAQIGALGSGLSLTYRHEVVSWGADMASLFHDRAGDYDIFNNSWGWFWEYEAAPQPEAAVRDISQSGEIVVFGAANSRGQNEDPYISADVNTHLFTHLPETIVVAGIGSDGVFSPYSNFGSNLTVAAPTSVFRSNGSDLTSPYDITTSDVTGAGGYNGTNEVAGPDSFPDANYTSVFGGTSSAAPLVSGILALAKEAQPQLNARFAKHLFARTSRMVDPTDATPTGGWTTNAAGFHFNNNYGFGLIDADALTLAATQYAGVTPLETHTTGLVNAGRERIGEDSQMSRAFTLPAAGALEEVEIRLQLRCTANNFNDIEGRITSPSGTTSVFWLPSGYDVGLFDYDNHSVYNLDWTFSSNAFWGEDPAGEWTITLYDRPILGALMQFGQVNWDGYEVITRSGTLLSLAAQEGDYDRDNDIDGADFLKWQRDFGASVTAFAESDGNGDQTVDGADFQLWVDNFGDPAALAAGRVVPEPRSLAFVVAALFLRGPLRRRTRV